MNPAWSSTGMASGPGPSRALLLNSGGGGVPEVAPLMLPAPGPGGDQPVISIFGRGARPHQCSPPSLQPDREVADVGVLQVLPDASPATAKTEQIDDLADRGAEPPLGPPALDRCVARPEVSWHLVGVPAVEEGVPVPIVLSELSGSSLAVWALVAHLQLYG